MSREELKASGSVTGASFRYRRTDGTSSSSKLSVSTRLLELLAIKLGDYQKAKDFCTGVATKHKEESLVSGKKVKISAVVKEEVFKQLIDEKFLLGYKLNTECKSLTCTFTDKDGVEHNSPLIMPTSLEYALSMLFGEKESKRLIKDDYAVVRETVVFENEEDKDNFSDIVRIYLLKYVTTPDLKPVVRKGLI